jgi:hypothetical protein
MLWMTLHSGGLLAEGQLCVAYTSDLQAVRPVMGEHWPTPSKKAIGLLGKGGLGYFCYCVGLLAIPRPPNFLLKQSPYLNGLLTNLWVENSRPLTNPTKIKAGHFLMTFFKRHYSLKKRSQTNWCHLFHNAR